MARILVLEDDPHCLGTLFAILHEVSQHEFVVCESVEAAMGELDASDYNLVICDLHIRRSRRQGRHFLWHLRSKDENLPVIVLTGMEYVAVHIRKGQTFYEGYRISRQVKKPIDYVELLRHIDEVIGGGP